VVDRETSMAHDMEQLGQSGSHEQLTQFIRFENVTIRVPGENILLKNINFEVDRNTLIMGPSGSGKTSILRVLASLWPKSGTVICPPNIFFLPQEVYLPIGNIVQQLAYPMHQNEVSITKEEISQLLIDVGLNIFLDRHDLYTETHWNFLSPGQRQKLVMARVLYHQKKSPLVLVLDEATSHLDGLSEDSIYNLCKDRDILVLSISHKNSLKSYHENILVVSNFTLQPEQDEE